MKELLFNNSFLCTHPKLKGGDMKAHPNLLRQIFRNILAPGVRVFHQKVIISLTASKSLGYYLVVKTVIFFVREITQADIQKNSVHALSKNILCLIPTHPQSKRESNPKLEESLLSSQFFIINQQCSINHSDVWNYTLSHSSKIYAILTA